MNDTSGVVELDSLVGSATVVMLFCSDELADLADALTSELEWYASKNVHIVLVAADEAVAATPPTPAATSGARIVTDTEGELSERYWPGPHAWPATVVLGDDGTMVARVEGGAPEVHLERLREAVTAHIGTRGSR